MVDARHKRNGIYLLPIILSFLDLPDDTPDTAEVRIAFHGLSADKLLRRLMRRCGVSGGTLLQHGICDSPRLSEALVRMVLDWAMRGFPEAQRVRMAEVHAILCAWVCRDTGGGKVSMRQESYTWHALAAYGASLGLYRLFKGTRHAYRVAMRCMAPPSTVCPAHRRFQPPRLACIHPEAFRDAMDAQQYDVGRVLLHHDQRPVQHVVRRKSPDPQAASNKTTR